jgi:translation elongation factor EF-4
MKKDYDFSKAKRGAVIPMPAGKTRITIRIDDDVLDSFRQAVHRAGGGNYQTLMNQALRAYVARQEGRKEMEDAIRRVVREELTPMRRVKKAAKKKASKGGVRRRKKSAAKKKPLRAAAKRRKRA